MEPTQKEARAGNESRLSKAHRGLRYGSSRGGESQSELFEHHYLQGNVNSTRIIEGREACAGLMLMPPPPVYLSCTGSHSMY